MKTATITEAKNRLSAFLDEVRSGESILILDRGRPVARLVPAIGDPAGRGGRLDRLERAGLVSRGTGEPVALLLSEDPPRPSDGASALRALLDERSEGR